MHVGCEVSVSDESPSSPSPSLRTLVSSQDVDDLGESEANLTSSSRTSSSKSKSTVPPSPYKFDIDAMLTALAREHDKVYDTLVRKSRETEELKKSLADCTQKISSSWIRRFESEEDKRRLRSSLGKVSHPFLIRWVFVDAGYICAYLVRMQAPRGCRDRRLSI